MERKFLSCKDVAERLGVSPNSVRKWYATRRLRGVKVGRLVRFTEEAISDFIHEEADNDQGC